MNLSDFVPKSGCGNKISNITENEANENVGKPNRKMFRLRHRECMRWKTCVFIDKLFMCSKRHYELKVNMKSLPYNKHCPILSPIIYVPKYLYGCYITKTLFAVATLFKQKIQNHETHKGYCMICVWLR